jgi:predicted RNA-binding protein associated with RNAse of E/G family
LAGLEETLAQFSDRDDLHYRLAPGRLGRAVYEAAIAFWKAVEGELADENQE